MTFLSPSSSERACDRLRRLIFDLEWLPGETLSESELVARLALSRTPLKQALQRLQREGLIEVLPRCGWRARPLDLAACDHAHELMALMEWHAVGRLCLSTSRPELTAWARQWMVPVSERHPMAAVVDDMDAAFHDALVASTGNPDMLACHRALAARLHRIRCLKVPRPAGIDRAYDEHAALLRAVVCRRLDEAQRLLKSHLDVARTESRQMALAAMLHARRRRSTPPTDDVSAECLTAPGEG